MKKKIATTRRSGTRILPIYIFSLVGKTPNLAIDGNTFFEAYYFILFYFEFNFSNNNLFIHLLSNSIVQKM